jgi:hypothetical protein
MEMVSKALEEEKELSFARPHPAKKGRVVL